MAADVAATTRSDAPHILLLVLVSFVLVSLVLRAVLTPLDLLLGI
jgi:hypothetical protein